MQFLFWLANHSPLGQRSLEDVIGVCGHQLRALGHTAVYDPSNKHLLTRALGYNVIVEGFTPKIVEVIAEQYNHGARFICIATEEPTPKGFNHGTQSEMVMRQKVFPKVAPYLDGILHLVPGKHVTQWYSQFAPTAQIELGYAPSLVRPGVLSQLSGATTSEPKYQFGFYGSVSPRRLKLLKKLAKSLNHPRPFKIVHDFKTQNERDDAMQEAKVILQIRKFDDMGLVSSSRCNTALMIGRPVVAEPHELSHPWDEVIRFAKSEDEFTATALATLAMWRGVHATQFARFKELMSPQWCIGNALAKIGVVPERAAA